MNGRFVLGVLLVLVVIVGAVGIGAYAYNMGVAQGMATSGKIEVPSTGAAPFPNYAPFFYRPFGFGFGFLGCLGPLILFFLFFSLLRLFLWGPRWGWRGMHHRHWDGDIPPMAEEFHRKLHEQQEKKSNAQP